MAEGIAHSLRNKWRSTDVRVRMQYAFSTLVRNRKILTGLKSEGFLRPSPVQALALLPAGSGRDMIVQSKSGTGKTCLIVIAALEHVTTMNPDLQVLIITPTREIAVQVQQVTLGIGKYFEGLKCEAFIGGHSHLEDISKLRNCQIAVGTPGRLKYLIKEAYMNTRSVELLILDEADSLVQSTFLQQIDIIISHLPKSRQMIAVSATYEYEDMSKFLEYMDDAEIIRVYGDELTLKGVLQFFHVFANDEYEKIYSSKLKVMLSILDSISFGQCIVFSESIPEVILLCKDLRRNGYAVSSICSRDDQHRRLLAIAELKECKIKILVSTDLTSRGIDVKNVDLVFNMDAGYDMERYVHRVGRAGRYGSRGIAITLVTEGYEVRRLLFYKVKGDFPVYPLPDPIPHDLKKYVPSTPALAEALLAYDVKRNPEIYEQVMKKSQGSIPNLDFTTEDLKDRKKKTEWQESEDPQSDLSFEKANAAYDTLLTSVEITNSSAGNSNMPLNDDKLPEGDTLSTEEAVIEGNNSVQQNLSMGSSNVELVVDEGSSPSCLKLEGKNEPSRGAIPKQKQRIQSGKKTKNKSEVNKLLVDKSHGDHEHREMDHQSKDLSFPTREIHKKKKYVPKAHKKANHHYHSTNNDYVSDNHCKLQERCCQKATSSTFLGHAYKTRDICSHYYSKFERKCYSSQVQNFDHMPQKCHECHCSRSCEYCDHRCSSVESIPMPFIFPPFFHQHPEEVDYGAILHEALLLSLSRK